MDLTGIGIPCISDRKISVAGGDEDRDGDRWKVETEMETEMETGGRWKGRGNSY